MKASKFEQGKFYAVAEFGNRPGDGCERMIYVMPWQGKYLFISADEDDEWTEEDARRAAQREEGRVLYDNRQPEGWLVSERAVACLWQDYDKWQTSHAYRSAAAIKAKEEKRLRDEEVEREKYKAEKEARAKTPFGRMEKNLEEFIGVRHAHLFQLGEDFDPEETVVLSLSIRFKNWRSLERFVGRMEEQVILRRRPPVIDAEPVESD